MRITRQFKKDTRKRIYIGRGKKPPKGVRVIRGRDGGNYYYATGRSKKPKPTTTPRIKNPVEALLSKLKRRTAGKGNSIVFESEKELKTVLDNGVFGIVSAGKNPNNKEDMKLTELQIAERHIKLENELKQSGYLFTKMKGKYGQEEESFLVMVHDTSKNEIIKMGKKYNQDSVIFSEKGNNQLIYTTGENAGKITQGQGWSKVSKEQADFYSEIQFNKGKETMRFSLNIEKQELPQKELTKIANKYHSEIPSEKKKIIDESVKKFNEGTDTFGTHFKDGKWSPERNTLQTKIIGDYIKNFDKAKSKIPKVVFMAGLPASGKTYSTQQIFSEVKGSNGLLMKDKKGNNFLVINSDDIKKKLPEFQNGLGASEVHKESSEMGGMILSMARENQLNIIYDGTMRNIKKTEKELKLFKKQKYESTLIHVDVATNTALERAKKRFETEGRYVPYGFISETGSHILDSVDKTKGSFDKALHIDNNGKKPIISNLKGGNKDGDI